MKVVLAEKPSVARDIAAVLGATTKRDGYFEGNDYIVTYAFGHLVTLAEPETMNPDWGKPWRVEQLPMIPENWKYRIVDKAAAQFNVIKKLFNDAKTTSIICATDAGREGEHIFRLIYKLSGCKKPVERLWISSLTADAIKDGFSKLKPSTEFDNLADAATARAHADWVVGLNFTRAYTTINRQLCTIGRVQTPTLGLIVDRQKLIDSFKSTNFFEVLVTFEPGFIARYITPGEEPQTRLPDKATAQAIVKTIAPLTEGTVSSVVTTEKKTKAPALYDLLTLQKDANKRFGYTAQETLDIAQSLYEEHKLISYPRTESRHLSTDMVGELPRILSTVLQSWLTPQKVKDAFKAEKIVPGSITASLLKPKLTKSYVDDAKLTDHHAIIPTHKTPPEGLPQKQRNVYELVANRFMSIFLPPEVRDETTAIIAMAEHLFRARGVVIKDPGWTILEPAQVKAADKKEKAAKTKEKGKDKDKDKDAAKDATNAEDSQQLPPLTKGQKVPKRKEELKEGKTSAPKPYDDSSLLTAMKNAGQELDDEDLASYMKQKGLGTPATRAAIIERLLQTAYIERQKKHLLPTEKGTALIGQVHSDLKDIALTASWEQRLADMQDGKLPLNNFESDIAGFIRRILPDVTSSKARLPWIQAKGAAASNGKKNGTGTEGGTNGGDTANAAPSFGKCPQCKQGVIRETPKGAGCSGWREGCTFSIWREQYGKTLTDANIKELVTKGKTKVIKGLKKKDGNGTYDAKLYINEEFKTRVEPGSIVDPGLGACPQCKEGVVRETPKGAGCNRWKEGCTFTIWKEVAGKELSEEQIKELFTKKKTKVIKGFKKKDGGTFDASLVINDQFKVRFEFDNSAN
jgi:DNA topoisomerase III